MQTISIIIIILVLAIVGIAHVHYREKVGLAPNQTRICAASNTADCHNVDNQIVAAVHAKALAIAQADEAETFPIEASDDIDSVYKIEPDILETVCVTVAKELNINTKRVAGNHYFDQAKTVNELMLFLHFQQLANNQSDKRKVSA